MNIKEEIAKILYYNDGGMTNECYIKVTGKARLIWHDLEQHEQDEYLWMASKVLEFIRDMLK